MNDNTQMTSTPGTSLIPDSTSVITTMHLVIMAIFALVVIVGILWGMRLKRRRDAADREIARDNAQINHGVTDHTDTPEAPTPTPAPAPTPASQTPASAPAPSLAPPPVTTATPPLTDAPVVGTSPATFTPPAPIATESAKPDPALSGASDAIPVTTLKGLGPKVAARLAELDITDARQLAALDDAGAAALDAQLGSFAGRMARDRWIDQARLLASGDRAGYEATFGKL